MHKPKKRSIDKCPNRLFLKYLAEWRDKAQEHGTKAHLVYNRAYNSLLKYPLPLKCGKEAKIIEHFGDKICKRLDEKLAKDAAEEDMTSDDYLEKSRSVHASWWKTVEDQCTPAKIPKRKDNGESSKPKKEYIPQKNSGPYALLIALYKEYTNENGKGFMTKSELMHDAQPMCNSSFTVSPTNSHYTAWSSMATLITKNLVHKYGNPAKFELTTEGSELANKLYLASNNNVAVETSKRTKKFKEIASQESEEPKTQPIKSIDLTLSDSEDMIPTSCDSSQGFGTNWTLTNYNIILCVDIRETMGGGQTKRKEMKRVLQKYDIPHIEKCLNLGDFMWVAQEVRHDGKKPKELVLDYIVERKCMNDLAQSIRDGRYREQKLRLKRSGIKNIIYLVEDLKQIQHQSLPEKTLKQAIENTRMVENIHVQLTEDIDASAKYLQILTQSLSELYASKILHCVDYNKSDRNENELISFGDFNEAGSKYKNTTMQQLFTRQLMVIHSMSYTKAKTITDKYPTLQHLITAYNLCQTEKEKIALLSTLKSGLLQRNIGINLSKIVLQIFGT